MERIIDLPHGGPGGDFAVDDLVKYIRSTGRDYIIQGQVNCTRTNHPKPSSLDVWLRDFAHSPDTKQAVNQVVDALVETGFFEVRHDLICPDSGRRCKGIGLIQPEECCTALYRQDSVKMSRGTDT